MFPVGNRRFLKNQWIMHCVQVNSAIWILPGSNDLGIHLIQDWQGYSHGYELISIQNSHHNTCIMKLLALHTPMSLDTTPCLHRGKKEMGVEGDCWKVITEEVNQQKRLSNIVADSSEDSILVHNHLNGYWWKRSEVRAEMIHGKWAFESSAFLKRKTNRTTLIEIEE